MFESGTECFTFLVIPNESSIKHGTCNMMIISKHLKTLQLEIKHRYSLGQPFHYNKTISIPSASYIHDKKYKSILESISKYVSNFPHINFELFRYKSFLSIETQLWAHPTCQNVMLMDELPKYDYEGTCFKFRAILSMDTKHTQIKFRVRFSKEEVDSLTNYMNRFLVLAWTDSGHVNTAPGQSLNLSITDEILMEDEPLQFHFTGQQLPLVWKSFGQVLKIGIIAGQDLKENTLIHVTVMAIFNPTFIYSFFWSYGHTARANIPCHVNATHVTSDSCWTVHEDFQGNWNSASEICRNQGGRLWSVNSDKEWNEVLTSPRYYNLDETPEYQFLQPLNAMRYFRTSSLIYLGLKSDQKVRTSINSICFFS